MCCPLDWIAYSLQPPITNCNYNSHCPRNWNTKNMAYLLKTYTIIVAEIFPIPVFTPISFQLVSTEAYRYNKCYSTQRKPNKTQGRITPIMGIRAMPHSVNSCHFSMDRRE